MIESIYIAEEKGMDQQLKDSVEVRAGLGIVGDRNFGQAQWPGQNVTFIEREEIDGFNERHNRSISQSSTRRNIITTGVRLNELVGKKFTMGDVEFIGVELCEPCKTLGEFLSNDSMPVSSVVKSFISRGGLRANVLSSGVISVGMALSIKDA